MKLLKKAFGGREAVYRKGTEEGFLQGYLEAKKEMEDKIKVLEVEVENLKSQIKVAQDQINLLGRLNNLARDYSEETDNQKA